MESTAGDSELGGQDVDATLVGHALAAAAAGRRVPGAHAARARQRLRKACERAKRMLSAGTQTPK